MSAARDFKGDYSPGGLAPRAARRARARRAGILSGRARRRLAHGRRVPHRRTRDQALALTYRQRQVTRREFERLYRRARPTGNEGGLETGYQHYLAVFCRYRRDGQHYRTTNQQRAAALTTRGRPRCRRQVQRLNRLLADMGLAVVSHYRDQGATPGHRDCLVVELRTPRSKNVTPPAGAGALPSARGSCSAPKGSSCTETTGRASPSLSPPPSAADEEGPPEAAVTERDQVAGQLEFAELMLRVGFGDRVLVGERAAQLRRRLHRIRERDDHASS